MSLDYQTELAEVVRSICGSPEDLDLPDQLDWGQHWRAPRREGHLRVEVGDWLTPIMDSWEGPIYGEAHSHLLTVRWQDPDPQQSTRVAVQFQLRGDRRGDTITLFVFGRRAYLESHPDYLRHPLPVEDGLEVGGELPEARGYWAPEVSLREGIRLRAVSECWDLGDLRPEAEFVLIDEGARVAGVAPQVTNLRWDTDQPSRTAEEWLAHFPDLHQYHCGQVSHYRHPDHSWQTVPPPDGIPSLWVHSQAEWPLIGQASRVLIPRHLMKSSLFPDGGYRIRGSGRWYICLRTRAKSARSVADQSYC